MRLAISMTHYQRAEYSRQALEALAACGGIEDVVIYPRIEPGHADVIATVKAFDAAPCLPYVNAVRHGVNFNTLRAIDRAFEAGADFVVHVEDDILLAPDALRYFSWAAARFVDDDHVATITGYHREATRPATLRHYEARSRVWFHAWGWGTWLNRWQVLRRAIKPVPLTWDCLVNDLVNRTGSREVFPVLARSQNIGHYSSIHPGVFTPEWYAEHHTLQHWADGISPDGGPFGYTGHAIEEDRGLAPARAELLAAGINGSE